MPRAPSGDRHTALQPPIIHQDIKPANILLGPGPGVDGAGIIAKLADFGISRVAPELAPSQAKSYVKTQNPAGTPIYMPMEYHMAGRVSTKVDAYAFGVVLLELLTGRPPFDFSTREPLVDQIYAELLEPKRFMNAIADRAAGSWPASKWVRLAVVARRCSEARSVDRATVADVLDIIDELAGRRSHGGKHKGARSWF